MLICLFTFPSKYLFAEDKEYIDYQYIVDNDNNVIFTVAVYDVGTIIFQGKHANSSSGITYHTVGFNLSLKQHDIRYSTTNDDFYFIQRDTNDENSSDSWGVPDKDYTVDYYRLDCNNVVSGLLSLLKRDGNTTQQAYKKLASGVTVYLSNAFEVIDRESKRRIGTEVYHTYQDIIQSVKTLRNISWSEETKEILKSYYNNPIQVKLKPYTYNVLYVDAKDYASKGTNATTLFQGESNQLVIFGQKAQANLLPASSLVYKGTKYIYSSAQYVYNNGMSNAASLSNGTLSAYHGYKSDASLYVLLNKDNSSVSPTTPTPPVIVTPTVTENSISYFDADSKGVIQTDTSKTLGFNAITGIPTTEYLYGSIQTAEYLLNVQYQLKIGQITYPITVSKTYYREKSSKEDISNQATQTNSSQSNSTQSNQNNNGPSDITDTEAITVTQSGSVTRSYQYTEIVSIDYYKVQQGSLTNATLPGSTITLTPVGYSIPSLSYEHYEGQGNHILSPNNIGGTITLASETVTEIPSEDLVSQGASQVGSIRVRNDSLIFAGKTVLDSVWVNQAAAGINLSAITRPKQTASQILYQGGQQIERSLANGNYTSSGTITYQRITGFQSSLPPTITYPISVNSVQLHTPIYCEPNIVQDNKTYLQLVNPDLSSIPLIIDENSQTSDFILNISNQGYHSGKSGYHNRDYSTYVATKDGKLRNEVKFPVEFYEDTGNDNNPSNDQLILPGVWTILPTRNQRYYLPMWVKEGKYTIEVRSVANNGESDLNKTQQLSNESIQNYVASNSFQVEVSGRLYGLTMYNVNDYPLWESVFLSSNHLLLKRNLDKNATQLIPSGVINNKYNADLVYDYRAGILDSYGVPSSRLSRYTFPLINGSHPQYANKGLLTSGYQTSFLLYTNGNEMANQNSKIEITPRFYYVDSTGKQREEVDLYYKGSVNGKKYSIIKVGSELDKINQKVYTVGSSNLGIPTKELNITAELMGLTLNQLKAKKQELYSYSQIVLGSTFRMYSNLDYATKYQDQNHTKEVLTTLKQTSYFQYSLPNQVRAVSKGYDVASYAAQKGITYKEDFWKKDGYLIVNFDIKAYDSRGNLRYSYTNKENYLNQGLCCMWLLEGYQMTKTDNQGVNFNFLLGDVLLYDTDTSASDDYASSGIY